MASLELKQLTKKFGDFTAVDSMDLQVADGEMIALLGGSGCGKTTTLRMIAGFTEPFSGSILVDGKDVAGIPAYKRNIGIFFQNYALFPHMTVFENIAFGLKIQKLPKAEIAERVSEMLELVKLYGMEKRYPRELSGGQQQRVALARALVTRPSIVLLDEPLSNLDAKLRVEMQVEIKRIQKELNITTIIVTHDHEEAVSLADRVIVMNAGRILQVGTPKEVFDDPNSAFVADFMGFSTFIKGSVKLELPDRLIVECSGHDLSVKRSVRDDLREGDNCILAIRSENIAIVPEDNMENRFVSGSNEIYAQENIVKGRVESITYKGHSTRVEVSGCFEENVYPAPNDYTGPGAGGELRLYFPSDKLCIYKN